MKRLLKLILRFLPTKIIKFLVKCLLKANQSNLSFSISINANSPSGTYDVDLQPYDLRILNDGSAISKLAFYMGADGIEPGELAAWEILCSGSKNVIEIGGNVGLYTLVGSAATDGFYTVYEPHPINYRSLQQNIILNNSKAICVEQAVVGTDGPSKIMLHVPILETGNTSTGAFVSDAEGIDRKSTEAFEVTTTNYESFPYVPDLLKLDVEGAEFTILNSMQNVLCKNRTIILVEVRRPPKTKQLRKWLYDFSKKSDYRLFAICPGFPEIRLQEIENIVLQDKFQTRDIIMIPSEKINLIKAQLD